MPFGSQLPRLVGGRWDDGTKVEDGVDRHVPDSRQAMATCMHAVPHCFGFLCWQEVWATLSSTGQLAVGLAVQAKVGQAWRCWPPQFCQLHGEV